MKLCSPPYQCFKEHPTLGVVYLEDVDKNKVCKEGDCHIVHSTNKVLHSIDKRLEEGSPWHEGAHLVLLGAFFAALFSYIFTKVHWSTTKKSERMEFFRRSISESLDSIETHSMGYWMKNGDLPPMFRNRIYASWHLLTKFSGELFSQIDEENKYKIVKLKKRKEQEKTINDVKAKIFELFEEVTGGDFGSKRMAADTSRAQRICIKCAHLKASIQCL